MKFSQLIESVSKKPIPPHQKNAVVEIMAADENDEDVEVPFLLVGLEWHDFVMAGYPIS